MPRPPEVSQVARSLPGAVYSAFAERLARHAGETYPLHVGDTWLEPPARCRVSDLDRPGLHRYAPPAGLPALVDALVERERTRGGAACERANVLPTVGATGGLAAAVATLAGPGEEVLLAAPYWPLIAGIVRAAGATPVPVPLVGAPEDGAPTDPAGVVAAVRARITPRTVALYVSSPGNPTGRVLPPAWLEALVGAAREADLWVLSDEVYEDHRYAGPEHVPVRALAPERTITARSCSKAWGMAGLRCGWLVGPEAVIAAIRGVTTHAVYGPPTPAQEVAARALAGPGDAWAADARARYAQVGREAARRLGVPAPEGGTFLWLDVRPALAGSEGGLDALLARCVDRGLLVAPGPSFGPFPGHVRVCFTATPPEVTLRGVDVLAQVLAEATGR